MRPEERQRRHDERWQKEVLDGMARMLDVLHDISDHLQKVAADLESARSATTKPVAERARPVLLTVNSLAELLGLRPNAVRTILAGGGPPVTRIGHRMYFHRDDIDRWLTEIRPANPVRRPWRHSYTPGRIGHDFPSTSDPDTSWCAGSHTEPLAAGKYHGRGTCRICRDEVLINNNGRLRKHRP